MSQPVIVRPLAEADIFEAQEWYEAQQPGLGRDFRQTIDEFFQRLGRSPKIYPEVYRGVSRAVLRRFPYSIYFVNTADAVFVVACLHGKRRRRIVRARMP